MTEEKHIPVDVLNANLRRLGRSLDRATINRHGWQNEEYGLHCTWPDGFSAFVGFGTEASAFIESFDQQQH